MAESLDDGEFWLPSQFLTDDDFDIFSDVNNMKKQSNNGINSNSLKGKDGTETEFFKNFFPFEFGSFGIPSDLSSPVDESVISSTEESDEEDYIAGLTCKMARSTLETTKDVVLSRSPQSTLCGVGNGCRRSQGSSRGSPNGSSKVSSPPPATWDLLYAAAGEVAKIRMNQQQEQQQEGYSSYYCNDGFSRGILGQPQKPVIKNSTPDFGVFNYPPPQQQPQQQQQQHSLSYQKLQASQFQQLRMQQMMKQQRSNVWATGQSKGFFQQQQPAVVHNSNNSSSNRGRRTLGLSPSAWPSLQQVHQQQQQQNQPTSVGMRAVFLGNPNAKKECAGTGVFLPRRVGTTTEPRKKPACSTVLLPARVVQALNLNLDEMGPPPQYQPRFNGTFAPDSDDNALRFVYNQKHNLRPQPEICSELRLPQEWTY